MSSEMVLHTAQDISLPVLREAMIDAFSDYAVPMHPSQADFDVMMRQRGFMPAMSMVALDQQKVVAIWLVGVRGSAAYLISSGTRPTYRRRGVARQMAMRSLAKLRAAGLQSFQTEVLAVNTTAAALYFDLGMTIHRKLRCWHVSLPALGGDTWVQVTNWADIVHEAPALWDWRPSWQHDAAALAAVGEDELTVLAHRDADGLAAFAVMIKRSRTVAQIAVRSDVRRKGVGRQMVRMLSAGKNVRFINADGGDTGFGAFMESLCAAQIPGQLEVHMSRASDARAAIWV